MNNLLFKKLNPEAQTPVRQHPDDAGLDLFSVEDTVIPAQGRTVVGTGISVAIPKGYAGFIQPRSGLAAKRGITVLNTPGLIDSGYRGELLVILYNTNLYNYAEIGKGDRIAQLVILPVAFPELVEVSELEKSDRGEGGLGSTDEVILS